MTNETQSTTENDQEGGDDTRTDNKKDLSPEYLNWTEYLHDHDHGETLYRVKLGEKSGGRNIVDERPTVALHYVEDDDRYLLRLEDVSTIEVMQVPDDVDVVKQASNGFVDRHMEFIVEKKGMNLEDVVDVETVADGYEGDVSELVDMVEEPYR